MNSRDLGACGMPESAKRLFREHQISSARPQSWSEAQQARFWSIQAHRWVAIDAPIPTSLSACVARVRAFVFDLEFRDDEDKVFSASLTTLAMAPPRSGGTALPI